LILITHYAITFSLTLITLMPLILLIIDIATLTLFSPLRHYWW
jgi:hypothetical protein